MTHHMCVQELDRHGVREPDVADVEPRIAPHDVLDEQLPTMLRPGPERERVHERRHARALVRDSGRDEENANKKHGDETDRHNARHYLDASTERQEVDHQQWHCERNRDEHGDEADLHADGCLQQHGLEHIPLLHRQQNVRQVGHSAAEAVNHRGQSSAHVQRALGPRCNQTSDGNEADHLHDVFVVRNGEAVLQQQTNA
mmetsp:Transcript_30840/g.86060  ORF Transcript_30840/g.86060 Transcript_30840/m.86060 type:complete len:200 (+) Transcript_30840:260-859(+)